MNEIPMPLPLLSLKTIEERYDIPSDTIRKMIARGEIGYVKKNPPKKQSMIRVPEQEIDRVLTYFPPINEVEVVKSI